MDASEIERYLQDYIKSSLLNDVYPLVASSTVPVASSTVPQEGGLFAALREIFAYIDYFGYLYKGASFARNAVAFLRDYLGKVDSRYSQVGGLLYYIYRHGPMHNYQPKCVTLNDGKIVKWVVSKSKTGANHLSVFTSDGNTFNVWIDINQLYVDLNSAIDKYIANIRTNPDLQANFKKVRDKTTKGDDQVDVMRTAKSYVSGGDFDFVRNNAK